MYRVSSSPRRWDRHISGTCLTPIEFIGGGGGRRRGCRRLRGVVRCGERLHRSPLGMFGASLRIGIDDMSRVVRASDRWRRVRAGRALGSGIGLVVGKDRGDVAGDITSYSGGICPTIRIVGRDSGRGRRVVARRC